MPHKLILDRKHISDIWTERKLRQEKSSPHRNRVFFRIEIFPNKKISKQCFVSLTRGFLVPIKSKGTPDKQTMVKEYEKRLRNESR